MKLAFFGPSIKFIFKTLFKILFVSAWTAFSIQNICLDPVALAVKIFSLYNRRLKVNSASFNLGNFSRFFGWCFDIYGWRDGNNKKEQQNSFDVEIFFYFWLSVKFLSISLRFIVHLTPPPPKQIPNRRFDDVFVSTPFSTVRISDQVT